MSHIALVLHFIQSVTLHEAQGKQKNNILLFSLKQRQRADNWTKIFYHHKERFGSLLTTE